MNRRSLIKGVAVAGAAAATGVRPAGALERIAPKTGPFSGRLHTAEEVEYSRGQLFELGRRAWVDMPNDPGLTRPWGMTVTYIGESGQMVVNAFTQQYDIGGPSDESDRPERHLWMPVDPEQTTFLGNPDRALLRKAVVAREDNASSVVHPYDPFRLEFRLNPLQFEGGIDSVSDAELYDPNEQASKNVNNVIDTSGESAQAKPYTGRGMDGVVIPGSAFPGKVDKYDLHVMQLLAKSFKSQTINGPRLPMMQTIYRGEGSASDLAQGIRDYVVDVRARNPRTFGFEDDNGQPYGMMRVNVKVQFDENGRIVNLPSDRAAEAMTVDTNLPTPSVDMAAYVHRPSWIPTLFVSNETGEVIPLAGDTYKYGPEDGYAGLGIGGAANHRAVIDWDKTLPPRENGKPHHWRGPLGG